MPVFKIPYRTDDYVVDRHILKDKRLNGIEMFILLHCHAQEADYNPSIVELSELSGFKITPLKRAIRNLVSYGYIRQKDTLGPCGKVLHREYHIFEKCLPGGPEGVSRAAPENASSFSTESADGEIVQTGAGSISDLYNNTIVSVFNTNSSEEQKEKECSGEGEDFKNNKKHYVSEKHAVKTQKQKKPKKTSLPENFVVTEAMEAWYHQQPGFVIPVRAATEKWIDAMLASDRQYINWVAAWRNGMRLENKWENERRKRNGQLTPGQIAANHIADCLGEERPF